MIQLEMQVTLGSQVKTLIVLWMHSSRANIGSVNCLQAWRVTCPWTMMHLSQLLTKWARELEPTQARKVQALQE